MGARQPKGGPHAPEIPTPTPAVNLRFNIEGLAKRLEGTGGLFVGEGEEKPKQHSVDASGRGDDRRREGVTQAWGRVALRCWSESERNDGFYQGKEEWVLWKIPRGDIDGVGEVK